MRHSNQSEDEMKLVRQPLPKTRKCKLTEVLRKNLVGVFCYDKRFVVWQAHSRWVWWNFHRDGK